MGTIRCAECGGIIMGELLYTGDQYCKCNEKPLKTATELELDVDWVDWNTLSLDDMVEYLRNKYQVSSTGDAKCIHHLIEFYDKNKD